MGGLAFLEEKEHTAYDTGAQMGTVCSKYFEVGLYGTSTKDVVIGCFGRGSRGGCVNIILEQGEL